MLTSLSGLCLSLAVVGAPPEAARAVLRDQHGRSDSLAAHAGRAQVVLVVALRRLRRIEAWEVELTRQVEGVGFLRVADVPPKEGQSPPSHEEIAATLRRRVPAEVSVLIDRERHWAEAFELDTREVNVLLFDAAGDLVSRLRGSPKPERVQEVVEGLVRQPGVRRKGAAASRP